MLCSVAFVVFQPEGLEQDSPGQSVTAAGSKRRPG